MSTSIDLDDYEVEGFLKCPFCFVAFEGSIEIGYFCPCCYVDLEFVQNQVSDHD